MAKSSGNTRSVKNFIVDGEFLTQLLECPVCLGQLKSSSRVLPCQHTFCENCLYAVYKAKNRLDCPECRTPVNIPFSQLPRNILLVRFLEGVKNKKVKNAEEVYPRSARSSSLKQASLPQSSSNIPTAADVYKKMKEDPQYKAIIENLNGNKRASEEPAPPGTSAKRMSEPEQPSQPSTSMGRIPGQPSQPSTSVGRIPGQSSQPSTSVGMIPGQPSQPSTSVGKIPGQPSQPSTSVGRIPGQPSQPSTSVGRIPGQPSQPSTSVGRIPGQPSQPSTSVGRIPGQPSQPSNSAKNISPDEKAAQNLRRLCEALKVSEALKASQSNLFAKMSTEPNKSYESRFQKRNKHILTKIVRALNYPNYCSYTGPRKK